MSEAREFFRRVSGLHDKIAADVVSASGGPGILRCTECGRERSMTDAQVGRNLSRGWPKCCGYTMTWVTGNQLRGEASNG